MTASLLLTAVAVLGQPPAKAKKSPDVPPHVRESIAINRFVEQSRSLLLPLPSDPLGRNAGLVSLLVRETATDAQLRELAAVSPKSLGGLSLVNCPAVTEATFAKFGSPPRLTDLGLPPHLTDKAYAKLAERFPALTKFSNQNADSAPGKMTAKGLAEVCAATTLTELKLAADLSDDCWAELAKLTELETLDMRAKKAKGKGLGGLGECKKLTSLTVGFPLSAAGELGKLSALEYLNLVDGPVTASALADLQSLPKLKSVTLLRVPPDASLLKALAQTPALKQLDIRHTTVTPAAVAGLKAFKQLDLLNLTFASASPVAVAELKKALPATVVFPPTTPTP